MKKVLIFAMCKQHKHGANVIIKLQNDKNYEKNIAKEYEAIYKSDYICGDILVCNDDEVR